MAIRKNFNTTTELAEKLTRLSKVIKDQSSPVLGSTEEKEGFDTKVTRLMRPHSLRPARSLKRGSSFKNPN